jgi:hypothetical protein
VVVQEWRSEVICENGDAIGGGRGVYGRVRWDSPKRLRRWYAYAVMLSSVLRASSMELNVAGTCGVTGSFDS